MVEQARIHRFARRIMSRVSLTLFLNLCAVFAGEQARAQDPGQWHRVATTGPSARYMASMAYDSARGRTVLFGGYESTSNFLSDTWEWDGSTWKQVAAAGPSARYYASMAYDIARGKTVLFGGLNLSGFLSDTWEWDGSAWKQVAATGPSARDSASMTYDSVRGKTVLFGGWNVDVTKFLSDTWEWDGSAWKPVAATGPSARCVAPMAFDSVRGRTVLFGGYFYDVDYNPHDCGDTWEWDGSAWKLVANTGPLPRSDASLAYDSSRGVTVLFGGMDINNSALSDTWEWDGSAWKQTATGGPAARFDATMAYDSARGRTVLFGGYDWYNFYADTWEYSGSHAFTNQATLSALRIAGGVSSAGLDAVKTLDVVTTGQSAGRVDIADAVRIARKVAGLEANP